MKNNIEMNHPKKKYGILRGCLTVFGAEVRSNFQFIIDIDSDTIQSFIFDGEELIK